MLGTSACHQSADNLPAQRRASRVPLGSPRRSSPQRHRRNASAHRGPAKRSTRCRVPCPLATYKAVAGASECRKCPVTKTTLQTGSDSPYDCVCLPAFEPDVAGNCYPCPEGHYKADAGDSPCTPCVNGVISHDGTACICGRGYSGSDVGSCTACPAGTFKAFTGPGDCAECLPGQYSPSDASAPLASTARRSCTPSAH